MARTFKSRVAYAAANLPTLGNCHNHKLDGCFEHYDGDYVVTALVRRAATDATLLEVIQRRWPNWEIEARHYAHLSDAEVESEAARRRRSMVA